MLQKLTNAIPAAPKSSGQTSEDSTLGIIGAGNPEGTAPTTATPFVCNFRKKTIAQPRTATIKGAGSLGSNRLIKSSKAKSESPTIKVGQCVSLNLEINRAQVRKNPPDGTVKPNSFPSCPTIIVSAMPFR